MDVAYRLKRDFEIYRLSTTVLIDIAVAGLDRVSPASFGITDSDRDGPITEEESYRLRNRGVGEFGITSVRVSDKSVMWRYKRGLPYVPSPVLYQGVLYIVRTGGIVTTLLGVNDLGESISASPSIADGAIFIRTDSRLYCFRQR